MPVYVNNTNRRITWPPKQLVWMPGQEHAVRYFIPHFDIGVDMVSPEPYVLRTYERDIGYHEMIVEPGSPIEDRTYWCPYWHTIQVSVFVMATDVGCVDVLPGEDQPTIENHDVVRMFIGDSETPIIIDGQNNHLAHYPWDICGYLLFESDQPTKLVIKVEPYTYIGTEITGR